MLNFPCVGAIRYWGNRSAYIDISPETSPICCLAVWGRCMQITLETSNSMVGISHIFTSHVGSVCVQIFFAAFKMFTWCYFRPAVQLLFYKARFIFHPTVIVASRSQWYPDQIPLELTVVYLIAEVELGCLWLSASTVRTEVKCACLSYALTFFLWVGLEGSQISVLCNSFSNSWRIYRVLSLKQSYKLHSWILLSPLLCHAGEKRKHSLNLPAALCDPGWTWLPKCRCVWSWDLPGA